MRKEKKYHTPIFKSIHPNLVQCTEKYNIFVHLDDTFEVGAKLHMN